MNKDVFEGKEEEMRDRYLYPGFWEMQGGHFVCESKNFIRRPEE
jgi:hypothetical protein